MKHWSHLNTARHILQSYNGKEPFASWLKKYFSTDKKFGSKDRKQIGHLCYCYYRLGKLGMDIPLEERIILGWFLCREKAGNGEAIEEWVDKAKKIVEQGLSLTNIFPWKEELSSGIEHTLFCESHLIQPDLFLRLRPGKEKTVLAKLEEKEIKFTQPGPSCISLPNATRIENIIELDREAVVQDYNSQLTGDFLKNLKPKTENLKPSLWDCCAGSGGKSIMAKDILGEIDLVVSDIRESILFNLKKRFREAGIKLYRSFVADLAQDKIDNSLLPASPHIILADVPCTGSGTWGRTPEQLFYFDKEMINEYAVKQERILSNVIPSLGEGGYLLYITCSVFKKENEDQVDFIRRHFPLELISMKVLKGYDKKADTMFAALLRKVDE